MGKLVMLIPNQMSKFQMFKSSSGIYPIITSICGWLMVIMLLHIPSAQAIPLDGSQLFEAQCAGCHAGGGNIIRRGKNLKLKALQKNKVDTQEAIVNLVTAGKGNMSAYADRLTPEEIQTVSAYVLAQAAQNWKSE